MTTILLVILLLIADLLLTGLVLHWLANWLMAKKVTPARTVVVTALMVFVDLCATISLVYALPDDKSANALLAPLFLLLGMTIANVAIVATIFQLSVLRSFAAWVLLLVIFNVLAVGQRYLLHKTVFQTYQQEGMAMTPTIVGLHRTGKCAHCGGRLIVRPGADPPVGPPLDDETKREAICGECLQFVMADKPLSKDRGADRIICAVFLEPQRWDVVVYFAPGQSAPWVSRVVGLPGEKVVVKEDGAVYVNGVKMTPPKEIAGIEYEGKIQAGNGIGYFVDAESPTALGSDEYCLLGDFSKNSMDSRYLGPIRRKDIQGVVTVCYWPIGRWRVWR